MALPSAGIHVNPSDETILLGPLTVRFLLSGEHSLGTVAAFEIVVPAGQRLAAPAHSHDHYEETIYGIAGVLTWAVDGAAIDVGPGQALCIRRGAAHRFDNNGRDEVIVDFGAAGLWQYWNDSIWSQLHAWSPEGLTIGRFQ